MKYAAHVLALTLTLASLTAAAQLPSNQTLVAQVPFQFNVANSAVPAGEWTIKSSSPGSPALTMNNHRCQGGLVAMARADEAKQASPSCALVFHKYGETYFLTGIKIAARATPTSCRKVRGSVNCRLRACLQPSRFCWPL